MEFLQRINRTFENIRTILKCKDNADGQAALKRDISALSTDLAVLGKQSHEDYFRALAMEGYLALIQTKTLLSSLADKRDILLAAYEKIKPCAYRDECCFVFLRIQNLLCYHLIHLEQLELAREILETTEEFCEKISSDHKYLDAEFMFSCEPLSAVRCIEPGKIDKLITSNVQLQAFVYNKLNMTDKYCLYNHTALRRQIELKEGTPQEWALKCARLGNYFTYLNQMKNARHHLCASYFVLRTCHDNYKLVPEEFVLHKADFELNFLELGHHFVKYGLALFKQSKKNILNKYFSDTVPKDVWKTVKLIPDKFDDDSLKDSVGNSQGDALDDTFMFKSLDLKEMETKIPSEYVCSVEEARKLFSFTHKWIMRTKHFYDFEHHQAQYISCSLQLAELYEHLAFFEKNLDNQYNIQKRRADVLETLKSLLKTCDNSMSIQIDVIRELSQVQLELMALNMQKLWREEETHANIFHENVDADSIFNFLDKESSHTLTERTSTSSRNIFLRKMEATTALNGKLFRLSAQLTKPELSLPSQFSFSSNSNVL